MYSSSLPKGRPSIYRSLYQSRSIAPCKEHATVSTAMVTPVTPASLPSSLAQDESNTASDDITPDGPPSALTNLDAEVELGTDCGINEEPDFASDQDIALDISSASTLEPLDMPLDAFPGTWQWAQPSIEEDLELLDWNRLGSSTSTLFWERTAETHNNRAAVSLALPCIEEAPPSPSPPDVSTADPHHRHTSTHSDTANPEASRHAADRNRECVLSPTCSMDKHDSNVVITQLSQLSMRLASLRVSSCELSALVSSPYIPGDSYIKEQAWHVQLLDDAAFEGVTSWLAGNPVAFPTPSGPTPGLDSRGGILSQVFSASHHLLEILHSLQLNVPPFSPSTPPSSSQQRSSGAIIRHLVIACYTSLLSIYRAVLVALGHGSHHTSQQAAMRSSPLGQIRLVSVVQLCSYLIRLQRHAVDAYLSCPLGSHNGLAMPRRSCQDLNNWSISSQPPSVEPVLRHDLCGCNDGGEHKREAEEVEERLAQLQQALRI